MGDHGEHIEQQARLGPGEAELKRSSAEFLEHVDAIRALEAEKRDLAADDERRPELARRIEAMAMDLFGRSQYQSHLISAQARQEAPPVRPLHVILADWRDADRRLRAAHELTRGATAEAKVFRDEYERNLEMGHSDPRT